MSKLSSACMLPTSDFPPGSARKEFEKLAGEMKEVRNMEDHEARKERACVHPACWTAEVSGIGNCPFNSAWSFLRSLCDFPKEWIGVEFQRVL